MAQPKGRPLPPVPSGRQPVKQPTSRAENNDTTRISPGVAMPRHGARAARGDGKGGGTNHP